MVAPRVPKSSPLGLQLALILLCTAYITILISTYHKPLSLAVTIGYSLEIVAMGLMILFHKNLTHWTSAIFGFCMIILIKVVTIYRRYFILNKHM